ncbi:MAG: hypothetical protein ACKO5K_03160 [Armatimonadota bacterium]
MAPIILQSEFDEPSDWMDLAIACALPELSPTHVVAPAERIDAVREFAGPAGRSVEWLTSCRAVDALAGAREGTAWIATGGFDHLDALIRRERAAYRRRIVRTFVVGGHANRLGRTVRPIDPRLRDRHPERFGADGDPRVFEPEALDACLRSGEGVVWLPRDLCLWRFDAAGMLEELHGEWAERVRALAQGATGGSEPFLMSTLPAFLLAALPDTTVWLRWFRVEEARFADDGIVGFGANEPNLHVVTAIDGHLLGRRIQDILRCVPGSDR